MPNLSYRGHRLIFVLGLALTLNTQACSKDRDCSDILLQLYDIASYVYDQDREAAEAVDKLVFEAKLTTLFSRKVDISGLKVSADKICRLGYSFGDKQWGAVPGSLFLCDEDLSKKNAIKSARKKLRELGFGSGPGRPTVESLYDGIRDIPRGTDRKVSRFADRHYSAVAQGFAWKVPFNLDGCVRVMSKQYAKMLENTAELNCQRFVWPKKIVSEMRTRLKDSLDRAEELLDKKVPSRPAVQLESVTAARCYHKARSAPALRVGKNQSVEVAWQNAKAFPIHLFAGETLLVQAKSSGYKFKLFLNNGDCSSKLKIDSGGMTIPAIIRYTATKSGTLALAMGTYSDNPITVSYDVSITKGSGHLSADRREEIDDYKQWAKNVDDKVILSVWRYTSPNDLKLGCLYSQLYDNSAVLTRDARTNALGACMERLKSTVAAYREVAKARRPSK